MATDAHRREGTEVRGQMSEVRRARDRGQRSEVRCQKGKRKKFWVMGFEFWMEEREGEKVRR